MGGKYEKANHYSYVSSGFRIDTICRSGICTKHPGEKGDTLWGLSRKYDTTIGKIKSENSLHSDMIYAGQTLSINGKTSSSKSVTLPVLHLLHTK